MIDENKTRKENNKRVLDKWKAGDNLATSTPEDSWFPARGRFNRETGRMESTYVQKKVESNLKLVINNEEENV